MAFLERLSACQLKEWPPVPATKPGWAPVLPDLRYAQAGFRFLMYVSLYNMSYTPIHLPVSIQTVAEILTFR